MKLLLIVLISLSYPSVDNFKLQNGDLIFQESCSGDISNAIKDVTSSTDKYNFTHVGMVYIKENDSIYVIEATQPEVKITPLSKFLYPADEKECYPQSVVGRLKEKYRHCIPQAIKEGMSLIGKKYDYGYNLNNDKYYCSELIYHILLKANNGNPIFHLNKMTFKSKGTKKFLPEWVNYFKELNTPIPEGKPGINPGAMSKADVIDIIHHY
ncbi:YiiX/YebB-like N1pC/P60 family cysteine hydrolase [uncultured Bacteroides sp.]|uniref:YiiX/YebB-like N1pC/P60 family cysteine hydrolase n=1 Tax=uncultured Bacteroides sp. TaxID=162156 RepID=UPI002AA933DC|nr:YiiX/YebB-like N1pC/P60 family cysteine hydrolase [uncultured Bacteroides sp.]